MHKVLQFKGIINDKKKKKKKRKNYQKVESKRLQKKRARKHDGQISPKAVKAERQTTLIRFSALKAGLV